MINMNNLVANIGHKNLSEADETQRKTDDQAMKAVNSLFNELFIIYQAYLPTLNKTHGKDANDALNANKKLWLKQLQKHKITPKMLKIGITRAEDDPDSFFPSPAKFIEMCHPTESDLGIPEVMDAYKMACNHTRGMAAKDYIHEIVFETGKSVGFFELSGTSEQIMLPKFKKQYDYFKSILMRGEKICETPIAIEYEAEPKPIDNRTPAQKRADMIKAKEQAMERML